MYEIDRKLEQLQKEGNPIRVGLIGAGQMGTDIVSQISCMVGIEVSVVVDLKTETALNAYKIAGLEEKDIIETSDIDTASKAIRQGKKVVSTNYKVATRAEPIQVVIDATGSPQMGALISLDCINHKKHIVMLNVECDVTVGPIIRQLAENAGIVYSLAAGDDPAAIIELYRFAKALGFKIVAAGRGKNNLLDIYATPDQLETEAKESGMSTKMLVQFVDGSKTMVEMASVSNATGLVPDIRGMHGPRCNTKDLLKVFCRKDQGGILEKEGVVDYAIGDVYPAVFVIVTTDNPRLRSALIQMDMGYGPNYLLLRPYHLSSIEVPLTVVQEVLYGESSGHPLKTPVSECITVAKRDLKKGEVLDDMGGYCYRASIELYSIAKKENMLPVGLAQGARLKCEVEKDQIITWDMVELNEGSVLLQLRRLQDNILG
jgi:predicted homoserine dehydrogenase-like protein